DAESNSASRFSSAIWSGENGMACPLYCFGLELLLVPRYRGGFTTVVYEAAASDKVYLRWSCPLMPRFQLNRTKQIYFSDQFLTNLDPHPGRIQVSSQNSAYLAGNGFWAFALQWQGEPNAPSGSGYRARSPTSTLFNVVVIVSRCLLRITESATK
ncbi:hypothetical protein, partial [Marinobacter xestospongiae]|uniref:hypothetical protein n=1 Tax=Marinobacter xestospongiae TaxID=994319 RepID=UPI002005AD71